MDSRRVILIETKGRYCRTVWHAVSLEISQMLLGAVLMSVFIYTLSDGQWHVLLCTLGLHFCMAQAILSFNHAGGWSRFLGLRHRKFAHILLQILGFITTLVGFIVLMNAVKFSDLGSSVHGISGSVACLGVILNIIIGIVTTRFYGCWSYVHMICGMITFLASSVCVISGFTYDIFLNIVCIENTIGIMITLIVCVCFYTVIILLEPIVKCIMML